MLGALLSLAVGLSLRGSGVTEKGLEAGFKPLTLSLRVITKKRAGYKKKNVFHPKLQVSLELLHTNS